VADEEPRKLPCGTFAAFDEMTWPTVGEEMGQVGWLLRYSEEREAARGGEEERQKLELVAASVIEAYRELVWCPRSKREAVVRRLRQVEREAR
jgi:hypothetical protein